jgi:hypothetical protein
MLVTIVAIILDPTVLEVYAVMLDPADEWAKILCGRASAAIITSGCTGGVVLELPPLPPPPPPNPPPVDMRGLILF